VALQLARWWKAANVTTTTSSANFALVRSLGATTTIDYHAASWWEVVPDASVDVVYDCVGEGGTGDRAVAKLRSGGSYVTITGSLAPGPLPPNTTQHMFINSDTNLDSAPLLSELAGLSEVGALRMPVIDSAFALEDVGQGFARSQTHHAVGKISVKAPEPTDEQLTAAKAMWREDRGARGAGEPSGERPTRSVPRRTR
jgi:NADPH2:quinone reductase